MGRLRITLASPEETRGLGQTFAEILAPHSILALKGSLGSGKTTFVQGLALGLGINVPVVSPTFNYFHLYEGKLPLVHFDLYRLKERGDFFRMGFEEYVEIPGIVAIEWPEILLPELPATLLSFQIILEGREVLVESDDLDLLHSLEIHGTITD